VLPAGGDVVEVAVHVAVGGEDLGRQAIGQRALDAGGELDAPAAADAGLGDAAERARRPARAHQHRATGDVAAEQRALRAAQHFDRFEVQRILQPAKVGADVHAVDERADGRLDRGDGAVEAHAAHRVVRHAGEGAAVVEADVGQGLADVGQVGSEHRLDLRAADRGQRDRHVLRALGRALLAGTHDDVLDHRLGAAARLLGLGGGGRGILGMGGYDRDKRRTGQQRYPEC